jgi:hypothetical protein
LLCNERDDDADFTAAFEYLQKDKSLCPTSFDVLLARHNVTDAEDLKLAEMEVIILLCGLLNRDVVTLASVLLSCRITLCLFLR